MFRTRVARVALLWDPWQHRNFEKALGGLPANCDRTSRELAAKLAEAI